MSAQKWNWSLLYCAAVMSALLGFGLYVGTVYVTQTHGSVYESAKLTGSYIEPSPQVWVPPGFRFDTDRSRSDRLRSRRQTQAQTQLSIEKHAETTLAPDDFHEEPQDETPALDSAPNEPPRTAPEPRWTVPVWPYDKLRTWNV